MINKKGETVLVCHYTSACPSMLLLASSRTVMTLTFANLGGRLMIGRILTHTVFRVQSTVVEIDDGIKLVSCLLVNALPLLAPNPAALNVLSLWTAPL